MGQPTEPVAGASLDVSAAEPLPSFDRRSARALAAAFSPYVMLLLAWIAYDHFLSVVFGAMAGLLVVAGPAYGLSAGYAAEQRLRSMEPDERPPGLQMARAARRISAATVALCVALAGLRIYLGG